MKLKVLSTLALCGVLLFSCSKDGEVGPAGPKGEQGVQGPQGIAGKDGTKIYSGNAAPDNAVGADGDFYLKLDDQRLFGPKTAGKWDKSISLKGKDGENGVDGTDGENGKNGTNGKDGTNGVNGSDGNTILSGNSAPQLSQGKAGDFFINLTSMTFYGPKTSSSWGSGISLLAKAPLAKRILIKENFSFSTCNQCYTYSTDWLPGYSTLNASTADELLNVGNIQEYYDKGTVTYEVRINKGSWQRLEGNQMVWDPTVEDRQYYLMISPPSIQYYRNSGKLFIGSSWSIEIPGNHSFATVVQTMKQELKVDIRITLLPGEEIEFISKAPKNQAPVKAQKI